MPGTDALPWLTIIGIGADGAASLAPAALDAVRAARVIFGGARQLALIEGITPARQIVLPRPFSAALDALDKRRGTPTALFASGDPMWFGIGATLAQRYSAAEIHIIPSPSSFSLAAARLGWPLAECRCISLHGRMLAGFMREIHPGAQLLCLSKNGDTPAQIARQLALIGLGEAQITVLEMLGSAEERIVQQSASQFSHRPADLNIVALRLPERLPPKIARAPACGLADSQFCHDGTITKSAVRAITLARLAPFARARLIDIGAGSGTVSIEWMRAAPGARAVAIEPNAARCAAIRQNAAALGTPELVIIEGKAPDALAGLDPADAVFIGGGIAQADAHSPVLNAAFAALKPGGILVANCVTTQGEAVLLDACERLGGSLSRIQISEAEPLGKVTGWRALMPVTQWRCVK